ncbi:GCN5 family acetyltransferase [Bacillus sp. FJAT-27225]|uniref:GNAT family N-acetyltransferase n=1 Tax=Bacillus sp. FJAT-27225 TaxID=1743144 RepID=UPI00080C309F|nr:N-acetyltransferase [Bacillus sp. FJAT-27225]OCA84370.1 GCN5 family acetyltransferase [Bacillus sp. FJAT-27225]
MAVYIRQENEKDYLNTEKLIQRAFANVAISDKTEHKLVARLRGSKSFVPELSLVAFDDVSGEIVGHVLMTKANIQSAETLTLAPVSVLPEYQNKGIGTRLINEALERARHSDFSSVIVLGHPRYYSGFGFEKASKWGIKAPWDVPDEVFMAMELNRGSLENKSETVVYPKEFNE